MYKTNKQTIKYVYVCIQQHNYTTLNQDNNYNQDNNQYKSLRKWLLSQNYMQ